MRFYIDADLLGLAKVLVQVRGDVTYPGDPGGMFHKRQRPACPITSQDTKDVNWLPETARRSWLIITRDWHIGDHRAEITAVKESAARLVTLAGREARDKFSQLEVVMCQWRRIQQLLDEPGPFIYQATRTSLRQIPLDS